MFRNSAYHIEEKQNRIQERYICSISGRIQAYRAGCNKLDVYNDRLPASILVSIGRWFKSRSRSRNRLEQILQTINANEEETRPYFTGGETRRQVSLELKLPP